MMGNVNNVEVNIRLDPARDGLVKPAPEMKCSSRYALVVGTDGQSRVVSMKEAKQIIRDIGFLGRGVQLGTGDYLMIFNEGKCFTVDDGTFLVGSVLVVKLVGVQFLPLKSWEIDEVLELMAGQMVELRAGDISISAIDMSGRV